MRRTISVQVPDLAPLDLERELAALAWARLGSAPRYWIGDRPPS